MPRKQTEKQTNQAAPAAPIAPPAPDNLSGSIPGTSELDQLLGAAAAADQAAITQDLPRDPETGAIATPPEGPDYQQEGAQAVDFFADLVCAYAPKAEPIWNPTTKARIAPALGAVFEKYGWTMMNLPPELALAVVAGPVLFQTAKVIRAQATEDQANGQQQAPQQSGAPLVNDPAAAQHNPPMAPQMALYRHGVNPK